MATPDPNVKQVRIPWLILVKIGSVKCFHWHANLEEFLMLFYAVKHYVHVCGEGLRLIENVVSIIY